jgi:hypothetical protein
MNALLSPKSRELLARLRDNEGLRKQLCQTLDDQNEITIGVVKEKFLSSPGPNTLGVRTGLLRHSVNKIPATVSGNVLHSAVVSNVRYAAVHEFGFHGTVTVRAHSMRVALNDRYDVDGTQVNYITALRAGLLSRNQASKAAQASGKYTFTGKGKRGAKQTAVGGVVTVAEHSMTMNIKARRPFGQGIQERLPATARALGRTIVAFWNGGAK